MCLQMTLLWKGTRKGIIKCVSAEVVRKSSGKLKHREKDVWSLLRLKLQSAEACTQISWTTQVQTLMGPFGGEIFDPFTVGKAVGKAIQIALLWTLLIQLPMTL